MTAKTLCLLFLFALSSICNAGEIHYKFDDPDLKDWTLGGQQSQWQVENGELSTEFKGVPSSDLTTGNDNWGNYTVECKSKFLETFPGGMTWAAITVRYKDTGNNYAFGIDLANQRANVDVEFGGKSIAWLNRLINFKLELNKYYNLKVVIEDDHIQFFIDDNLIHDFKDGSLVTGKVGVMAIRAHVHFDDFIIKGPNITGSGEAIETSRNLVVSWGQIRNQH